MSLCSCFCYFNFVFRVFRYVLYWLAFNQVCCRFCVWFVLCISFCYMVLKKRLKVRERKPLGEAKPPSYWTFPFLGLHHLACILALPSLRLGSCALAPSVYMQQQKKHKMSRQTKEKTKKQRQHTKGKQTKDSTQRGKQTEDSTQRGKQACYNTQRGKQAFY